ncbi:XRE family transcriptional regulator [Paludibacterium denitrificans]|uniref:Helix-turn-helix domain-containing protein n=1 Tax=Paludibacterium denitrificans TaxID=2675226 RepID=A0A844GB85_9NEIS|nr:helix-turn-helix transcriptional regulator [Paludibacterium denitrificans]MTD32610.1 helix-turn-helix domain-containing protein [Paludibacterium denitrificans]
MITELQDKLTYMTTLSERVLLALESAKMDQSDLSRRVGVSSVAVNNWCTGATKSIKGENLLKAASALGVRPDWLAYGTGQMLATRNEKSKNTENELNLAPDLISFSQVPVVGHAQLGDNGNWAELEYPVGSGEGFVEWPTKDSNSYALRCMGNSMTPRIKQGEFVVVEPNTSYMNGDEVMVKSIDGRVMVKQFLYERDGTYCFVSINEDHPPIYINIENIEKIHFVAGIARRGQWRPAR